MKHDDVAFGVAQRRGRTRDVFEQVGQRLVVLARHLQARDVQGHVGWQEAPELRLRQTIAGGDDQAQLLAGPGGRFDGQVGGGC